MIYTTAKEWVWCILRPSYAKDTSLRISEHAEQVALKVLTGIVIAIFMACAFVAGIDWNKYQNLRQIRKEYNQIQIEIVPAAPQQKVRFL